MSTTAKGTKQAARKLPATYEAALEELESLVQRLESGQVPLDDLLAGYQRGAALLDFCKNKLKAVEDQIKVLDVESQVEQSAQSHHAQDDGGFEDADQDDIPF